MHARLTTGFFLFFLTAAQLCSQQAKAGETSAHRGEGRGSGIAPGAVVGVFEASLAGRAGQEHVFSVSTEPGFTKGRFVEPAPDPDEAAAVFTANLTSATQVALTVPASLTSLVPSSATAGGGGFVLTANGLDFVSGAVVRWNGSDRTTTFISPTQLIATIPATDVAAPGLAYVQVFIPGASGGLSNALPFTVNPAPIQLEVQPAALTFQATAGGSDPPTQVLRIGSKGASVNWTAQAATVNGGNWLSVSPSSGTASASAPALVVVTAKVAGLAAGVYSGSVSLQESATTGPITVPVTFSVAQAVPIISLTQTGLQFTAVEGGSAVPTQSFGIQNVGQGSLNPTLQATTFSGGTWLSASLATGAGQPFPTATVTVNATGLAAGDYYGEIAVSATGASNTPQSVSAQLRVLPRGGAPGAVALPVGLIFIGQAGAASPSAQPVRLATAAPAGLTASNITVSTTSGGSWLDVQPRTLTLAAGVAQNINVQATTGTLAAGLYQGTVTIPFSDGSTITLDVLFLVQSAATPARVGSAAACTPQKLLAVLRTLGSNFASPAGWPSPIVAQVIDDCGSRITNATVVASFSSGDPTLALSSLGDGTYSGTWRPVNSAARVTVTVRANLVPLTEASVQVQGGVQTNPSAPFVSSGGIVHAASFASREPVAPGSIVSVFGGKMAAATAQGAASLPLPTSLGGASLLIGGQKVPLYYSSEGQINAQIPFELAPNTKPQAVVRLSLPGVEAVTVPEIITLDVARPGVFMADAFGQGVVIDSQGRVVNSFVPAAAGDVVVVYAAGLGLTNPAVRSGEASPLDPLARVTVQPTVTIGGVSAEVTFAGLTPGLVGLYQLNVRIPSGVKPGPGVPLVVTQNGVSSKPVTLAIQ